MLKLLVDDQARTRVDKVNAELVTLTYGTIVAQLCNDYNHDYVQVNQQLDKMGYNIGVRLIEDFLAKSNMGRCGSFRDTAEMISKVWLHAKSVCGVSRMCLGWLQNLSQHNTDRHQLDS